MALKELLVAGFLSSGVAGDFPSEYSEQGCKLENSTDQYDPSLQAEYQNLQCDIEGFDLNSFDPDEFANSGRLATGSFAAVLITAGAKNIWNGYKVSSDRPQLVFEVAFGVSLVAAGTLVLTETVGDLPL